MSKKILLAAGGTGGHVFPSIALAEALIDKNYGVLIATDERGSKYLNQTKLIFKIIDVKVSTNGFIAKFCSVFSIIKATVQSLIFLKAHKPALVVGFGGYPSFPVLLACVIYKIPIVLHEQNSTLGRTNIFLAKFAKKIALAYAHTLKLKKQYNDKVVVSGDIVRSKIKVLPINDNFNQAIFTIFIFGGSQGAEIFDKIIPQIISLVTKNEPLIKLKIIQQICLKNQKTIEQIYDDLNIEYVLAEFFTDIENCYKQANLVISRSGAGTIAELTCLALPAIFIPYPYARDQEQLHNAIAISQIGGSWFFEQNSLDIKQISDLIIELIKNRNLLKNASNNLKKRSSDGLANIVNTIEEIILSN